MLPLSNSGLRGHSKKLYIEGANKDIRKYNFSLRVRKLWNSLPESVINCEDVKTFEFELDRHWENQDLMYNDYKAEIKLN